MKKFSTKNLIKYTLLFLLMAVLLFLAFRNVNWSDFWTSLLSCDFRWILATMAMQWIITYWRGNRWRIMMRPLSKDITRRETYDAYAICYLANIAFPRSGEVIRCGLIAERGKASFEGSLGTVVIERTWDLICVVLACIPLFFFGTFRDFLVEKMFRPAAESGMGIFWIIVVAAAALAALIWALYHFRAQISSSQFGSKCIRFCKGLADGIKAGFRMERKWAFFAYTLVIWIGYWLCSLWTMWAFPASAGMTGWDALFLMIVGSLGWIIPVQGGFGAYHVIVAMTLVPIYGFTYDTGLVFATISHESQIVQMLLCGLVSLVGWSVYRKKHKITA